MLGAKDFDGLFEGIKDGSGLGGKDVDGACDRKGRENEMVLLDSNSPP